MGFCGIWGFKSLGSFVNFNCFVWTQETFFVLLKTYPMFLRLLYLTFLVRHRIIRPVKSTPNKWVNWQQKLSPPPSPRQNSINQYWGGLRPWVPFTTPHSLVYLVGVLYLFGIVYCYIWYQDLYIWHFSLQRAISHKLWWCFSLTRQPDGCGLVSQAWRTMEPFCFRNLASVGQERETQANSG